MGNLIFSQQIVSQMMRVHDTSGIGEISIEEFRRLYHFLVTMQNSFNYYDTDKNGALTPDEIYRAIVQAGKESCLNSQLIGIVPLGFTLDKHAFYAMVQAFDPDRKGQLGLSDFVAMTLFLKSGEAIFSAFDPHTTGRVTIDFSSFVYACSNMR